MRKFKVDAKKKLEIIASFQKKFENENENSTKILESLRHFINSRVDKNFIYNTETPLLEINEVNLVLSELKSHFEAASKVECNKGTELFPNIVTYLKKGLAAIKFLFTCFVNVKDIFKQGIKEILNLLLNIATGGLLKILGIAVIISKIVFFLYKHSKAKQEKIQMEYKGKIVGSLLRIAFEIINLPGLISPIWNSSYSSESGSEINSETMSNRSSTNLSASSGRESSQSSITSSTRKTIASSNVGSDRSSGSFSRTSLGLSYTSDRKKRVRTKSLIR